ncbi:RNA polymerase sigma factor [Bailinhaonella thermotolerans]|uniref:Sigma-70 family RNA polymerase sigma factor n=1 Tax=Bailinhaonella thermotolerans TaxID=1070861 RepID=A0A3A4B901_9ACTN|nr:sigma-70 family RNA polymerase sigma factor [Bailinhaonella thermotolerans]RJL35379.1 sigma-70 family RNA polymerase sigma factor [Bailinhaonella thermotolerans]
MDDPEGRFTALYDRHYRSLLGYALLRAEQGVAEDVVSETFLVAWRRLPEVPEPALPWLIGVARNLLRKQRDSRLRGESLVDRFAALGGEPAAADVAEHVVAREAALAALAALPERDVEALVLTVWHGLTPAEAALATGSSRAAFAVRLHRARRRLARALDEAPAAPRVLSMTSQEQRCP